MSSALRYDGHDTMPLLLPPMLNLISSKAVELAGELACNLNQNQIPPNPRDRKQRRSHSSSAVLSKEINVQIGSYTTLSVVASTHTPAATFAKSSWPDGGWSTVSLPLLDVRRSSDTSCDRNRRFAGSRARPEFTSARNSRNISDFVLVEAAYSIPCAANRSRGHSPA
jgi:hypothetical protein